MKNKSEFPERHSIQPHIYEHGITDCLVAHKFMTSFSALSLLSLHFSSYLFPLLARVSISFWPVCLLNSRVWRNTTILPTCVCGEESAEMFFLITRLFRALFLLLAANVADAYQQCYYPDGSEPKDYTFVQCYTPSTNASSPSRHAPCCIPSEGDMCQNERPCY